jgi:hypothetical protein
VEREYLYSSNLSKKIIPLLYRPCELPLYYLNVHSIDVQGINYRRNYGEILRALNVVPVEQEPSPVPEKKAEQILSKRNWNSQNITILVALSVLVLVAIFSLPSLLAQPENTSMPTLTLTTELAQEPISTETRVIIAVSGATSTAKPVPLPATPRILPQTYLAFVSEEGDYIGQGHTMEFHTADYDFSFWQDNPEQLEIWVDDGRSSWHISFAAPRGQILEVGHYEGAERIPFKRFQNPGFEFTGDHRGCNELQAEFDILKLERDAHGNLIVFEADFVQYCDSNKAALRGQLRFYAQAEGG